MLLVFLLPKLKSVKLPPIRTENLDLDIDLDNPLPTAPPVPNMKTPFNPWAPALNGPWYRPATTPNPTGIRPSLNNTLSPDKITNTDPNFIITVLPPTPTDDPDKIFEYINSISAMAAG